MENSFVYTILIMRIMSRKKGALKPKLILGVFLCLFILTPSFLFSEDEIDNRQFPVIIKELKLKLKSAAGKERVDLLNKISNQQRHCPKRESWGGYQCHIIHSH